MDLMWSYGEKTNMTCLLYSIWCIFNRSILVRSSTDSIGGRAWESNYIHIHVWDVIIHVNRNFDTGKVNRRLILGMDG